ncbi:hypothetical protein GCM10028815_34690 [Mariniluteicoccus flavus]
MACTEDIMAETIHSIRRSAPHLSGGHIARVRELIVENVDDMIRDYAVGHFPGSDANDSHVHGAAVHAGIGILLTNDGGWSSIVDERPYDVYTADDFFCLVAKSAPQTVASVAIDQIRHHLSRPGVESVDLVDKLRKADCPHFAEQVRQLLMTVDLHGLTL